ncbi:hypothetical protein ACLMAJ_34670 [Nocardia sp. KC 131]|uniref:hypothetical protein n=1 Tax=Nocardia arseniciresistens TaxID=3392119 RepID=UPI00398F81D0
MGRSGDGEIIAEMVRTAERIADALVYKAAPYISETHHEFPHEILNTLRRIQHEDLRLAPEIYRVGPDARVDRGTAAEHPESSAGARGPDPTAIDDPYHARRESLFFDEDPERRAAARAEWRDELRGLVARGHHEQADREFGRTLGLPEYNFHGIPKDDRPQEQFDADGLVSKVAGRFGGREDVYPPEPSKLKYLTWAKEALNLGPDDVLVDVGSGTGKAIDFFGMFTDAKKVYGMEIEPDFAAFANQHAAGLGLNHVRTLNKDVLEESLPEDVTAVYFYEPFGSTKENDAVGTFANKLAEIGEQRPLKVAVKSANLAERLQAGGVFSLQDEKPFTFFIHGQPKTLSWKLFTSGQAAG